MEGTEGRYAGELVGWWAGVVGWTFERADSVASSDEALRPRS